MKKLLLLAVLPVLSACAPALYGASLTVAPNYLQLARGQSTSATIWFNKYVFSNEPKDEYTLTVLSTDVQSLYVTPFKTNLQAKDSATFTITATRNADLGKHTVTVLVSNHKGNQIQRSVTVNVIP